MLKTSGRWILGAILLLPGLITALTFHFLSDNQLTVDDLTRLPATAAGDASPPPQATVNEPDSDAGMVITDSQLFDNDLLSGRLVLQSPQYRFRRSETLNAHISLDISAGALPERYEFFVWLITPQGNFVADVTPQWQQGHHRITGRVKQPIAAGWPAQMRLQAMLRLPGQPPVEASLTTELYEPAATITGVDTPYAEGEDWVIPIKLTLYEPGVITITATLLDDTGATVTHLHCRQRMDNSGDVLMHVRRHLLSEGHESQNLLLGDIQVRHISDRSSAPLGWGDSERSRYVLPVFGR